MPKRAGKKVNRPVVIRAGCEGRDWGQVITVTEGNHSHELNPKEGKVKKRKAIGMDVACHRMTDGRSGNKFDFRGSSEENCFHKKGIQGKSMAQNRVVIRCSGTIR